MRVREEVVRVVGEYVQFLFWGARGGGGDIWPTLCWCRRSFPCHGAVLTVTYLRVLNKVK